MTKIFTTLLIAFFIILGLLVQGFAQEKIRGKLIKMELSIKDASGKETRVEAKGVERIQVGDKVTVKDDKARKGGKGSELLKIELTIKDASGKEIRAEAKEAERVQVGDEVVVKEGKVKKRGKGRGC